MVDRIVLATYGSLGDLYPYLAIARGLKARGYQPIIAAAEKYRSYVAAEEIEFHPLRLEDTWEQDNKFIQMLMDSQREVEYIICYQLMPHLLATYTDLMTAVRRADLLITHPLILPGRIVAEQTQIPWISTVISAFMSVYDSPGGDRFASRTEAIASPVSEYERCLQWVAKDAEQRQLRSRLRHWSAPLRQLRSSLGLPPGPDPLFEGQHSPDLVLALFSQVFARPQPDWPRQTVVTGFPFYDNPSNQGLSEELREFLDSGPPPIVFTLGSTVVWTPGNFYWSSAIAAHQLGYRSVLMMGPGADSVRPDQLPEGAIAVNYAPHGQIFPRAAAIVHHGGMGTTAEALRSGRRMLVVPHKYDQPENAARVVRLGVARMLPPQQYTAELVANELRQLLFEKQYAQKAAAIGEAIGAENGVETACDAIANLIGQYPSRKPAKYSDSPNDSQITYSP
ncbi:glycosyltransferase [Limnospira platensis]|uniref:glycosyltransferase n=1 Tax=Limnospira platensis TaxID=118562 RepID=UPI0002804410|nr:glycosyl transferase family 28 [Arthrospira platensis C1]UWU46352.1 glycosyltransferase, MGT family [Arthrospira platensis C1]